MPAKINNGNLVPKKLEQENARIGIQKSEENKQDRSATTYIRFTEIGFALETARLNSLWISIPATIDRMPIPAEIIPKVLNASIDEVLEKKIIKASLTTKVAPRKAEFKKGWIR